MSSEAMLREQGRTMPPVRIDDIPQEISDVSPAWLTAALSATHPAIEVSTVSADPLHLGTASTWRLRLTYAPGSAQGPETVCIKSDFNLPHKQYLAESGLYRKEASVYLDILPRTGARVPTCYAAGYTDAGRGFMLMSDLAAQGGKFCDPTSTLTVEQAAIGVEQLAKLHAASWNAPFIDAPEWMHHGCPLSRDDPFWDDIFGCYSELLEHPHAGAMPHVFRDGEIVHRGFNRLRRHDDRSACGLIHGDAHVGNFFVDASGAPGMADFQCVQRGTGTHDLAMFIGSSLDLVDRRSNEEALMRHYVACLERLGVSPPEFSDVWLSYRQHYLFALFAWLATTAGFQTQLHLVTNVFRYSMAALDLDSLGAIG